MAHAACAGLGKHYWCSFLSLSQHPSPTLQVSYSTSSHGVSGLTVPVLAKLPCSLPSTWPHIANKARIQVVPVLIEPRLHPLCTIWPDQSSAPHQGDNIHLVGFSAANIESKWLMPSREEPRLVSQKGSISSSSSFSSPVLCVEIQHRQAYSSR